MPSQTLGNIIDRVYARLDNNVALYDRQSVVDEINDAVKACNLFTGALQTTVPVFTEGRDLAPPRGRLVYSVPSPILFPVSVDYEGRSLSRLSLLSLAGTYLNWAIDTNSPGNPVKEWAPIGFTQFVIHPLDSLGGRELSVRGVVEPAEMVSDRDTLPLPDEFVEDIENLAGSVLPVREGGRIWNAAVAELFQAFLQRMREKTAWANLAWPEYYFKLIKKKPGVPAGAKLS